MQDKSEHYSEFSERTDKLAAALGKSVSALTKVIGIGNGTLFANRSGDYPISPKTWRKLAAAEQSLHPVDNLKKGGRTAFVLDEKTDNYETVASRFPQRREPSNRSDCLAYVLKLLDAAEVSGNPDNFPAIMARLKKQFPLDEWDEKPE